jgi:hypothetical protein
VQSESHQQPTRNFRFAIITLPCLSDGDVESFAMQAKPAGSRKSLHRKRKPNPTQPVSARRKALIRRDKRKRAERLRLMVDCLPYETRLAMLEGLGRYQIIAGAYSDRSGGVCPMLAAHRLGGRTDFRAFARAWDRFTGARRCARKATERELRTLASQLEASIWSGEDVLELRRHADRLAREKSTRKAARKADTRKAGRLESAPGAAWLLAFRSFDEYRVALEAALREADEADATAGPPRRSRPVVPSSPRG